MKKILIAASCLMILLAVVLIIQNFTSWVLITTTEFFVFALIYLAGLFLYLWDKEKSKNTAR